MAREFISLKKWWSVDAEQLIASAPLNQFSHYKWPRRYRLHMRSESEMRLINYRSTTWIHFGSGGGGGGNKSNQESIEADLFK